MTQVVANKRIFRKMVLNINCFLIRNIISELLHFRENQRVPCNTYSDLNFELWRQVPVTAPVQPPFPLRNQGFFPLMREGPPPDFQPPPPDFPPHEMPLHNPDQLPLMWGP